MRNTFLSVKEIENNYNSNLLVKKSISRDKVRKAILETKVARFSYCPLGKNYKKRGKSGPIFISGKDEEKVMTRITENSKSNNVGNKAEKKAIVALLEKGEIVSDGTYNFVPEIDKSVTKISLVDGVSVNYSSIFLGVSSRMEIIEAIGITSQGCDSKIDYFYQGVKASAKCVYSRPAIANASGQNSISFVFKVEQSVFDAVSLLFNVLKSNGTFGPKNESMGVVFQALSKESSYEVTYVCERLMKHYKVHGVLDDLTKNVVAKLLNGGSVKPEDPTLWANLFASLMTSFTPTYEISPENQANSVICLDKEGNALDGFPTEPIEFSKVVAPYVFFDTPEMSKVGADLTYNKLTKECTLTVPFCLRIGLPAHFEA